MLFLLRLSPELADYVLAKYETAASSERHSYLC